MSTEQRDVSPCIWGKARIILEAIPTLRIRDPDLFGHLGSGREGVGTLGSHFSGQIRLSGSGIRIFLVIWDPEGRELGLPDPTFRDPARL